MDLEALHPWSHRNHALLLSNEVKLFDATLQHLCVYLLGQIAPVLWGLEV